MAMAAAAEAAPEAAAAPVPTVPAGAGAARSVDACDVPPASVLTVPAGDVAAAARKLSAAGGKKPGRAGEWRRAPSRLTGARSAPTGTGPGAIGSAVVTGRGGTSTVQVDGTDGVGEPPPGSTGAASSAGARTVAGVVRTGAFMSAIGWLIGADGDVGPWSVTGATIVRIGAVVLTTWSMTGATDFTTGAVALTTWSMTGATVFTTGSVVLTTWSMTGATDFDDRRAVDA